METPDKNAHLSPVLSEIKDYGPGEPPLESESEFSALPPDSEQSLLEDPAPPQPQPDGEVGSPAKRGGAGRWVIYSLILLCLLTLIAGFAAFVWQQTRIDELLALRDAERRTAQDSIAAAESESAELSERVAILEGQIAGQRDSLADGGERTAELAAAGAAGDPGDVADPGDAGEPADQGDPGEQPEPDSAQQPARLLTAESGSDADAGESVAAPEEASSSVPGDASEHTAKPREPIAGPAPKTTVWFINLSTFSTEALASGWLAQLPGPPADAGIIPIESNGQRLYRVRIGGFESREEARGVAKRIMADWNLEGVWISSS